MADKIHIPVAKNRYLSALQRRPTKNITPERSKILVVMVHGFPGHKTGNNDLFGDIEFLLAERGLHSLRFDFQGCGESEGQEENFTIAKACEDFQKVLIWAKKKGYTHFILIGEGLGASLSIMNIDVRTKALILLWPILDPKSYARESYDIDTAAEKAGYIEQDKHRIGLTYLKELEKADLRYNLTENNMPALIMHGARDQNIPIEQLDIAREHSNAQRMEITVFHDGEAGLEKLSHRKTMFHEITRFIEKFT